MACGGKGFHWKAGTIVSHADGSELATTYAQGPTCRKCRGTGQTGLSMWGYVIAAVMALVLVAFVISPAIHLIFD